MEANLSLAQKGLLLGGILLSSQILFFGVLAKMQADRSQAQWRALHTKEVIVEAESVSRLLARSHAGLRDYVFSGMDIFAEEYTSSVAGLPARLDNLQRLTEDNFSQQERLRQLRNEILSTLQKMNELYQHMKTGRQGDAIDALRRLELKSIADAARKTLEEFTSEEERLDGERIPQLNRMATLQAWALAIGFVLSISCFVLLFLIFGRGAARRLKIVTDNTRRLALSERLAARMAGTDEISQLDHVFHDMAEALSQKNRENEMFVYSVSHDLRSPLVNLQGFSQELAAVCKDLRELLISNELPPAVRQRGLTLIDRDASEAIHFIQTAVSRLATIIDALLRLSRAGRVEYRFQMVELRPMVQKIVEALGRTLAERKAEIAIRELSPAWGDPTALEQIFANLIGNAANYLDPARPGKIEVGETGVLTNEQRTYYVRDNGRGIPEAHRAKLFVAFQRLHPDSAPGEGVGLALVRRMVERHGGNIWIESEPGVGSTFYFSLPVRPTGAGLESTDATANQVVKVPLNGGSTFLKGA